MQNSRLDQLMEMRKKEPADPFLKYAIATEYLKMGDTDKALSFYIDLAENHPDYVGTYYHLGKLYQKLSNPEKAETVFLKGMEIARKLKEMHAFSELQNAYSDLRGEDDF